MNILHIYYLNQHLEVRIFPACCTYVVRMILGVSKHYFHNINRLYVSLTVHLSITLANDQLDAQILNIFITILYMFREISCLSSGGQIVLIQHLVSSLSLTL